MAILSRCYLSFYKTIARKANDRRYSPVKKRILYGSLVMAGGIIFTALVAPLLHFIVSQIVYPDKVDIAVTVFASPIIYLAGIVFAGIIHRD